MLPLYYFYSIFQTIVAIVGALHYKRFGKPMRLLVWYVSAMSVVEWFEGGLAMLNIRNLWLFHFSTPLEFFLTLGVFYYWSTDKRYGRLIIFFAVAYAILCIVAMFTFEPLSTSNDLTDNVSSAIQIFCGIFLLMSILLDDKSILKSDPRFWFSAGIVFYAAGTLLLFGLFTVLLSTSKQLFKIVWPFNWVLSIISLGFYLRAILCKPMSLQNEPSQRDGKSKSPANITVVNK